MRGQANPVDWKVRDYGIWIQGFPIVLGTDIAGEVSAVGPDVKRIRPGDRVLAFVDSMTSAKLDRGAWQTCAPPLSLPLSALHPPPVPR